MDRMHAMTENAPQSIAASVVYFVAQQFGLPLTKRHIRIASETSEVTINKCCKKLEALHQEFGLIPPLLLQKWKRV
jgi:transcription initiation factor TFIIIB Brf1 subunit/transcription initiation factor TFIIB